ncbi:MAG: hypothetical protein KC766_25280, partial [Myxococcales bacterium]|nr:hypothetical protein [Myxococcales bacterium]
WTKASIPQRELANCDMFVGDPSKVPWPAAAWEPRGSYDAFVVKPPESEWMYQGTPWGWTIARHHVGDVDGLFLHLKYGGTHQGDEVIGFARIVRVSDLATVGVLANRYTHPTTVVCGQGNYRESALDVHYGGLIDPFYARLDPGSGNWSFVPQNDEFNGAQGFDLETPWEEYVAATGGVLRLNPNSGLSEAIRTNSATRLPASLGDTAVWSEDGEVWSTKGGATPTKALAGAPDYPCSIGITPEWVFGAGEQTAAGRCRDYPTNARVWRAKRNNDGSLGSVEFGPTITVQGFFNYSHGWGDFIGFATILQGDVELFVVRLSDWKTWQLNKSGTDSFHADVWGIDSEYLYTAINHTNLEVEELRRYPLAKLDDVATIIPAN